MKTSDRLVVWKFEAAPAELRGLSRLGGSPRWLALVPAGMVGPDLELTIRTQVGQMGLEVCRMPSGDVVYVGSSDVAEFLEAANAHATSATPSQQARQ